MQVEAGQLRQWCDPYGHTDRWGTFLVIGLNRLRTEEQGDGSIWDIMTDVGLDCHFEKVIMFNSEVVSEDR